MLRKVLTGLWATCVFATLCANTALAASTDIVLYSSDAAALHGNWTLAADATAASGQTLISADQGWANTNGPVAAPTDYVDFTFSAPAATAYHVWFRLRATANSKYNDSVFVQFSDALSKGAAVDKIGS